MPTYRRTLRVAITSENLRDVMRESTEAWDVLFTAMADLGTASDFELDADDVEIDADDSGVFEEVNPDDAEDEDEDEDDQPE